MPKPRSRGFLGSPWAAVISGAMALVMLTVAAVIYITGRPPERTALAPVVLGERAPSAFAFDMVAASSPFVTRGEAVSLILTAPSDVELDRVEVWQDSELVYGLDDVESVAGPATGQVRFTMDLVPMTAGPHLALARAYDTHGNLAQSVPLAIPTLDREEDLGEFLAKNANGEGLWPSLHLTTAPGESLASIGNRLGLDPATLVSADGTTTLNAPLPRGTRVSGTIVPENKLKPIQQLSADTLSYLNVAVEGCEVVVTSQEQTDLRVYGGAGMVALGDLPAGGELRLGTLPVGPTVLVGYPAGTSDPDAKPSFPITVTIPDACARDGWTGDAYISGGLMLTDYSIPRPYAYIAIDKGTWQRVPLQEGTYLASSNTMVTDLRPFLNLTAYDQIDVQVWSGIRGEGPQASGHFCRAAATAQSTHGGSGSTGECAPAKAPVVAGAPGAASALDLSISVEPAPGTDAASAGHFNKYVPYPPANRTPGVAITARQTGPLKLRFVTDAVEVLSAVGASPTSLTYQFSYLPMTAGSSGLNVPGVFATKQANPDGSLEIDPWMWHATKATPDSLDEVDGLSLNDEIAWGIARQRLLQGHDLIDTVYVRVVATTTSEAGNPVLAGAVSPNVKITMPPVWNGDYPTISAPTLSLAPGRVVNAEWVKAVDRFSKNPTTAIELCHEVVRYPAKQTFRLFGMEMDADPAFSDYKLAVAQWPSDKVLYCQDWNAPWERRAAAERRAAEQKCGVWCVLSFVIYGAAKGFLMGGPIGALIGAGVGLGVGLASAASDDFYQLFRGTWDMIASAYNSVFDKVWSVIDYINPICQGLGKITESKKAKAYCDTGFHAVGSVVVYAYTGMPTTILDSEQVFAEAEGNLTFLITRALDAALGELDLSCADFTLDESDGELVELVAKKLGVDPAKVKLTKDSSGKISGCAAIASLMTKAVMEMAMDRQGSVMQDITGIRKIPGLVLAPVGDTRPVLHFVAPRTDKTTKELPLSCPYVLNVEITPKEGKTQRLFPTEGMLEAPAASTSEWGKLLPQFWDTEIPIPESNPGGHDYYADSEGRLNSRGWKPSGPSNVREEVPAKPGAPYLHAQLDSPCFETTLVLDAPEFGADPTDSKAQAAYFSDGRTIRTYW